MTIKKNNYIESSIFKSTIFQILEDEMITYSDHAIERMKERNIKQSTIKNLFLSPYEFIGTQSENGMVYIARNKRNQHQLPKVIFGINKVEETNTLFINVITTYFDLQEADATEEKQMVYSLEHELDLAAKRDAIDLEQKLLLTNEQYNQLFMIITNEIYLPHISTYGYGALTTITPYKTHCDWTIRTANEVLTYHIENEVYANLLNRIHYGIFETNSRTKNEINIQVPNNEELPTYDNEPFNAYSHKIKQDDISTTTEAIKDITSSNRYGRLVNISLRSATRIEQAILAFEDELYGSFKYRTSPIQRIVTYEKAIIYFIKTDESKNKCYIITGKSHDYLESLCDNFVEVYGEKINCPKHIFESITEDIDAYLANQIDFEYIVNFSINTKEADLLVKMPNGSLKHVQLPHKAYHLILQKYGLESFIDQPKIAITPTKKVNKTPQIKEQSRQDKELVEKKKEEKRIARAEQKRLEEEQRKSENKRRREERDRKIKEAKRNKLQKEKCNLLTKPDETIQKTTTTLNPKYQFTEGLPFLERVAQLISLNRPYEFVDKMKWNDETNELSYTVYNLNPSEILNEVGKTIYWKNIFKEIEKLEKKTGVSIENINKKQHLILNYMKIKVLSSNEDIQEVKTQWNINLINSHWSYATLNWILNWFNITFKLNEEFLKSLLPKASLSKYVTVLSSLTKNEAVLSFIYCGTSKKCIHYHLVIDISDSKFDFLRKHMTTQSLTGEWAGGYWIRYDEKDEFENEMLSLMIDICNVLEYNFIYGAITRKGAMIVHFDSEENEHYVQKFIPDSELHRISLQLDNEELINNSLFIEKDTE